ncbi:MAG: FAD-dependent thymidylate synthase [Nanoarchaeota archaeon]|nr:FAD-dependent thymidylate synthase [Nanoarchaeota archaeon]MBU1027754.1 FAD-dependent thymidylate synthase [Nanoarchaeota archaeon]
MVKLVNPKVKILDYGPKIMSKNGKVILTPDELVYGGAIATYQDVDSMQELLNKKKEYFQLKKRLDNTTDFAKKQNLEAKIEDLDYSPKKIKNKILGICARGHASMATTPVVWFDIMNSSKLIDSIFTGARFGSFLMPSSRRVPITKENIVIPRGVKEKGRRAEKIYVESAENNVETYEKVQNNNVETQDASKIVHYGHAGGGRLQMPLDTIIYFKNLMDNDFDNAIPREGKEIISQLDSWIRDGSGMENIYVGKLRAPRTSCVNPNIFTFRRNRAEKLKEKLGIGIEPMILNKNIEKDNETIYRMQQWLDYRKEIFSDSDRLKNEGKKLLDKLDEIIVDNNGLINFEMGVKIPWRVWGEVKRHRTMPQTTESVYNAMDKTLEVVHNFELHKRNVDVEVILDAYLPIIDIPIPVQRNEDNLELWINAWDKSALAYQKLVEMGVEKSDAIMIVPRALLLANIKTYDLYNATTGYGSLRKCSSVENKMKEITRKELELIKESVDYKIGCLLEPKCEYIGYCPEINTCGNITQKFLPSYTKEFHKNFNKKRIKKIREELK